MPLMLALFRKAYRDVTKRRVRSLLTLAGIIIGVAGVVAIVSTGENLARAQEVAYANASQADISYWTWNAPTTAERAVAALDNVSAAELRVDLFTRCRWQPAAGSVGQVARDVSMHGVADFANMRVDQVLLKAGRFPEEGELVAEQSALQAAPLRLGDTVTCRGSGGSPDRRLTLVGIVQTPNYPSASILDYLTFYAPASDVRLLLGATGANGLLIKVSDFSRVSDTAREVGQLLDRRGISRGAPTIRDPQNYMGKRELDALLLLLFAFSVIGLLTSGFLVANTLAAIVGEQVGEIGTIKALGGTRSQVLLIYLFAAMLYGLVGTALGLVAGAILSWQLLAYIGSLLSLDTGTEISLFGLGLGIAVGMGVTLAAGSLPSIGATYIPVKQALEAYGISSTYGQGALDRLIRRLVSLPPLAAMSLRNLGRRKARTLVTILVIGVAVGVLLAAQSVSYSVNRAIDDLFKTYRADAWVYFGDYVSTAFEGRLRGLPFVKQAEIWSLQDVWVTFPTPRGDRAAQARLWGLPADTLLYQPRLTEGRWYRADEPDAVVISSDLAQSEQLELGEVLQLDTGDKTRWFRIVGIAVDNSVFLGSQVAGKVFLREDIVAAMQHRTGYGVFFAVSFDVHDPAGVQARLDEVSDRFSGFQISSDSAAREVSGAKEQTRVLTIALAAMSLLVGLIGALGVLNTLTLNVLERRREIGVLRSLGASDANLVQTFVTEGLALGVGGWFVGIALGYPLGAALLRIMESVLFQIDYAVNAQMILACLVLALVLSGAASLFPALAAARLRVSQVLRYE